MSQITVVGKGEHLYGAQRVGQGKGLQITAGKGRSANGDKSFGKGNTLQIFTAGKGAGADLGHRTGDSNGGQRCSFVKGVLADLGHAARDLISHTNQQRICLFFDQHAALYGVMLVFACHGQRFQHGELGKGVFAHRLQRGGEMDGFQRSAVVECPLSNGGQPLRQGNRSHQLAIFKGSFLNTRHGQTLIGAFYNDICTCLPNARDRIGLTVGIQKELQTAGVCLVSRTTRLGLGRAANAAGVFLNYVGGRGVGGHRAIAGISAPMGGFVAFPCEGVWESRSGQRKHIGNLGLAFGIREIFVAVLALPIGLVTGLCTGGRFFLVRGQHMGVFFGRSVLVAGAKQSAQYQ